MQILDKDPVNYIAIMDMGFMWPLAGLTRQALSNPMETASHGEIMLAKYFQSLWQDTSVHPILLW